MQLSPEERRKIYEEEKIRIEAEQKQRMTAGGSSTGLEPNVAGLLCYIGGWISGIVFLVIEQKNAFVRFHALQSIITFGGLTVAGALLGWIPYAGVVFGTVIGILAFILWVVLMVKAYRGELYKVPFAGQVAEGLAPASWHAEKPETGEEQKATGATHRKSRNTTRASRGTGSAHIRKGQGVWEANEGLLHKNHSRQGCWLYRRDLLQCSFPHILFLLLPVHSLVPC